MYSPVQRTEARFAVFVEVLMSCSCLSSCIPGRFSCASLRASQVNLVKQISGFFPFQLYPTNVTVTLHHDTLTFVHYGVVAKVFPYRTVLPCSFSHVQKLLFAYRSSSWGFRAAGIRYVALLPPSGTSLFIWPVSQTEQDKVA